MRRLYYAVPGLGLVIGLVGLLLVTLTDNPLTGWTLPWNPTMVTAFAAVGCLILLTLFVRNRGGLYLNALFMVVELALLLIFGIHPAALLGLGLFGGLIVGNGCLIYWLMARLPF